MEITKIQSSKDFNGASNMSPSEKFKIGDIVKVRDTLIIGRVERHIHAIAPSIRMTRKEVEIYTLTGSNINSYIESELELASKAETKYWKRMYKRKKMEEAI